LDQAASYQQTAHSRAFRDVETAREPEDGEYFHEASSRRYRVTRRHGQFRHVETLAVPHGEEIPLADFAMRYAIGSGRFTQSYLVEADGFLVESPITWYTAAGRWDMSPGYNRANHSAFERTVSVACLACHTGRVERLEQSRRRAAILEANIGCESCHGPGSLHVEHHTSGGDSQSPDLTIVNPRLLSRERQEDICARCHLQPAALAFVRGREGSQFRPGQRLADFQVHYRVAGAPGSMTLAGHIEQLRASACYQQSQTLTCTTCHDPHRQPSREAHVEHYRSRCVACHTLQGCKLPQPERAQKGDDCITCHMPSSGVEIPHTAFRHHRIGIHRDPQSSVNKEPPEDALLVPMEDVSHLSELDQQRCLGLAYGQLFESSPHPRRLDEAIRLLDQAWQSGLRDPAVSARLAHLYRARQDLTRAIEMAEATLARDEIDPHSRETALRSLSGALVDKQEWGRAEPFLEQLTALNRDADVWRLLAQCRQRRGDLHAAAEAWRQAINIRPADPGPHHQLSLVCQTLGRFEQARKHRRLADQLDSSPR
jgi:tetratricopeptide (TPR) repeat protein